MELGPELLRHRLVRRIADEEMPEPERVFAWKICPVGPDELLAHERLKVAADLCAQLGRRQRRDGSEVEDPALDRRALDDGALLIAQPVEPSSQQGLDRRRHGYLGQIARGDPASVSALEEAVVDQHRERLLDEERIALGRLGHALAHFFCKLGSPEQVSDQRLQENRGRVELPAAPHGTDVEQLRASEADQEDWSVAGPVRDVIDEIQEGRLAPLDVVEDEHERALPRVRLEELACCPECLLTRARAADEAERRSEARRDHLSVLVARQPRGDTREKVLAVELSHDVGEGPERDALAVRQAPALHDRSPLTGPGGELRDQTRLADAGGAEDCEEMTGAFADGALVGTLEKHPLALSTDHWRIEAARPAGNGRLDRQQAIGAEVRLLALELERLDRLDLDSVTDEAVRRLAEQDLAGGRRLLE